MNRTKVDWYQFRSQAKDPRMVVEALRRGFGEHGPLLQVRPNKRGWNGYEGSAELQLGDMRVGKMAYGGRAQKGWVMASITARGCDWITDWDLAQDECGQLPEYQTRRVDIALDTFNREVTYESVLQAHSRGAFSRGGRPPKLEKREGGLPSQGRTAYIGDRKSAQFFRGYEKGWELARKFPEGTITEIDGCPVADLFRMELELKVQQAPLPLDLIDRRDQYFAGGYPYLQEVLALEPEVFVQRRERGPQTDLAAAMSVLRHQWGSSLFTALAAYHGDISAVWGKIVGTKHNRALVEAGVLLVEHDD